MCYRYLNQRFLECHRQYFLIRPEDPTKTVLGGSVTIVAASSSDDLNNYTTPKNYFFDSGSQGLPANKPAGITSSFWLKVEMPVGQRIVQTAISPLDGSTFRRIKDGSGSWQNWIRVDSFGCATASDLASLLGVEFVCRGTANTSMDADQMFTSGWWGVLNEQRPSNTPYIGNGMLIIIYAPSVTLQFAIDTNTLKMYWRIRYGEWSVWKEFAFS